MDTLYLTREPVVDAQKTLIAYDLRVHRADASSSAPTEPFFGAANLVSNAFYGMGLENAVGSCFGFVNVDRTLLFDDLIQDLPAAEVVIGLAEGLEPERDVLFRVRELRERGYSFALSGYRGDAFHLEPLLDQMAVVQVDVSCASMALLESLRLEVRRPGVRLMAQKVQTPEQFERARGYGFDLFEGYHFLSGPRAGARAARSGAAALLRMLRLLKDDSDSAAIVEELKRQPTLSVATLRAANASSNALMLRKIASLHDALAILGRDRLARLVQMLVYAQESPAEIGHNPLLQTAVARAKLLEDLAAFDVTASTAERHAAFVVGLLSLIEWVIGLPLVEILDELHYASPLREALLHREGRLGVLLELAEKIEQSDDAGVANVLSELPSIRHEDLIRIQLGTLAWLRQSGVS